MKLKALQYLRYNRQPVQRGCVFDAAQSDARILMAIGRAEAYVEPPKQKPIPAVFKPILEPIVSEDEPTQADDKPKRAYKRRDMTAE